jgi:type II secretory pathway component PulF
MPNFSYQAISDSGKTIRGTVEADSEEMATSLLVGRGYIPVEVNIDSSGSGNDALSRLKDRFAKVKPQELILLTKQIRTMLRAGMPILSLLQVLEHQTENPKLRIVMSQMAGDIREGKTLYNAFSRHPEVFSRLYCSMVQAGEASGALPEVLDRLTYIIEHEDKIRSDIKSALQYPTIVMVFLTMAFFILLTFVIPKFTAIFISAGLDLPLPTRICMIMYDYLIGYWYILITGIAGAIVGSILYFKTPPGRFVRDTYLMKIPILGPLFMKSAMSRFASIFAILQASGIAILDSMTILSNTIGNAAVSREFDKIRDQLEEGRGIAAPLQSAKYFSPMVVNMVAIGEESGNLDEMLREVADHYDTEIEYAVHKLSEAIGPLLTIGLAAVVGFFALAIFLPMWDLTKMVK